VTNRGRTVVMTSHDLSRIEALATRFDVLTRGNVRASIASSALPQDGILGYYRQTLENARELPERPAV